MFGVCEFIEENIGRSKACLHLFGKRESMVRSFLLAAEAYGLGAVWTACYPFHDRMDPVAAYLNLPGNIVPYSIVPVGYPAGDEQPKDKWNPERIHYNRW